MNSGEGKPFFGRLGEVFKLRDGDDGADGLVRVDS